MRYGEPYIIMDVPPITWSKIKQRLDVLPTEPAKLGRKAVWQDKTEEYLSTNRDSRVGWIRDDDDLNLFFDMAEEANKVCGWNLGIDYLEPMQYTIYNEDGHYDWHVDQFEQPNAENQVRKISCTCWVNDEYKGGEFDLEIYNPNTNPRYKSFVAKPGKVIFFLSDQFHRVRPITSGVRKSLVGWFSGPPYV